MAELTTKGRNRMKKSEFALSGRRFPINDLAHARNALARAAQPQVKLTNAERARIRKKVQAKFPQLAKKKKARGEKPYTGGKRVAPRRSASPSKGPTTASKM